MQILLHADPHTDGSQPMVDHFSATVKAAMERFGNRVTRVEAHLTDANGHAKSSDDDIHCTLEARLVGLDAIVVKNQAGNPHQAIEGAVRKLQRAVSTEFAKHDPRGHRVKPALPDDGAGPEGDS